MKKSLLILICLIQSFVYSQSIPKLTLKDSSELKLSHLDIKVDIIGNYVSTKYSMKFWNSYDRILEGELSFPLAEGQTVSQFEMEVNGSMRQSVVVEKELARRAYENTVRQNIDPGLLEKTQGNNYKVRVYPINPNQYKELIITYEEELQSYNNKQTLELPLGFNTELNEFSLEIRVYDSNENPEIKTTPFEKLNFKPDNEGYIANYSGKNITPSESIVIDIPVSTQISRVHTNKDYFYAYIPFNRTPQLKSKPEQITILWDNSYSMRLRNLEKELDLLEQYFSHLKNVNVNFISFSNAVRKNLKYEVVNGNWNDLKSKITSLPYDGGTSYFSLNNIPNSSNEVLLFSDGLANLGITLKTADKPVYCINSITSANHEFLQNTATISGGQYINLNRTETERSIELLINESFQFLGVETNNKVTEVYPKQINVNEGLSLGGRFSNETELTLLFGQAGKITQRKKLQIRKNHSNNLAERLWAKQKLKHLNLDIEENKNEIVQHAVQYKLISDYTSMIVLDRLEDYVQYHIEPPSELRAQYKERLAEMENQQSWQAEEIAERKEDIFDDYKYIYDWYKTKYPKKEKKKKKTKNNPSTQNSNTSSNTVTAPTNNNGIASNNQNSNISTENNTQRATSQTTPIDPNKNVVSGVISDQSGPLPGAMVIVKGTSRGRQTDFDGKFSINAEPEDVLVISFIGMHTAEYTVGNSNNIILEMTESAQNLDEVVVVGYGSTQTEQAKMSSSVTRLLSGNISGLQVENAQSEPDAAIEKNPLLIVDGVVMDKFSLDSISPDDIENIVSLKAASATNIYGSRAANGLIVINTKKGLVENSEAIEKVNTLIEEKGAFKAWDPTTPYLNILNAEVSVELAYNKYLEIRETYVNSPSFFLDVSDFFAERGSHELAIRILTNLIEIELDNHELMRALAYKLEYFNEYRLAVHVYKEVLKLRPEEPQPYRDLALAYEHTGDYQKSFDLLFKLYNGELIEMDMDERFYGIEHLAFEELSRLIHKYPNQLNLKDIKKRNFPKMPVDFRVVIDWNHNDTDIDLWVIEPSGEKAFYKNTETVYGGFMSEDFVEGYGPEEYMIKKAPRGKYKVIADYFSDNLQKISGPTILKVTIFLNYATQNEVKKIVLVRLDKDEDEIEIDTVNMY